MGIKQREKMSIINTILKRRSIYHKDFTPGEISKETLLEILSCADAAPTHKKTQPWRFVVFRGEGKRQLAEEIGRLYQTHTDPEKYQDKTKEAMMSKALDAEVVIAIGVHYSGSVPAWEEVAATAAAVQNLWLAAFDKGIGGYWGTPGVIIKHIGPFLKLEEQAECLGFFYLGQHEAEPREPLRDPLEQKVRWVE